MKVDTLYSALYGGHFPFESLVKHRGNLETIREPGELKDINSALILWGGADISPELYNHEKSRRTGSYAARDMLEWALLQTAIAKGIPVIGVCRGAQMLCAAAGGTLYQHVSNHAGPNHEVVTNDARAFITNSIHHQMMNVEKVDHELLCSTYPLSNIYIEGADDEVEGPKQEPEFVYFPKIKGWAIQWHPEGMNESSKATQYILEKLHAA